MKQASLDIGVNLCLNVISEAIMDREDKEKLLNDIKFAYLNYGKFMGAIEVGKIEVIPDIPKER